MAQGAGKAKGAAAVAGPKSTGSQRKKVGQTRRGKFEVVPKGKAGLAARAQNKKLSSHINRSIEKQMVDAASAGKLSIMRHSGTGDVQPGAGKDKAKGKAKAK